MNQKISFSFRKPNYTNEDENIILFYNKIYADQNPDMDVKAIETLFRTYYIDSIFNNPETNERKTIIGTIQNYVDFYNIEIYINLNATGDDYEEYLELYYIAVEFTNLNNKELYYFIDKVELANNKQIKLSCSLDMKLNYFYDLPFNNRQAYITRKTQDRYAKYVKLIENAQRDDGIMNFTSIGTQNFYYASLKYTIPNLTNGFHNAGDLITSVLENIIFGYNANDKLNDFSESGIVSMEQEVIIYQEELETLFTYTWTSFATEGKPVNFTLGVITGADRENKGGIEIFLLSDTTNDIIGVPSQQIFYVRQLNINNGNWVMKFTINDNLITPNLDTNSGLYLEDNVFDFKNYIIKNYSFPVSYYIDTSGSSPVKEIQNLFYDGNINPKNTYKYAGGIGKTGLESMFLYAFLTTASGKVDEKTPQFVPYKVGNRLPLGTRLAPVLLDTTYIDNVGTFFDNNLYDVLGNLGNGYVIGIVALPVDFTEGENLSTPNYLDREFEDFDVEDKEGNQIKAKVFKAINGGNLFIRGDKYVRYLDFPLETEFSLIANVNLKIYNLTFEDNYDYLKEVKLLDEEFTRFKYNITAQATPYYSFLYAMEKGSSNITFTYNFTIAPHIFGLLMKPITGLYKTAIATNTGLTSYQQNLAIITNSSAYSTFLTNHKNSYNVSLQQGKLGIGLSYLSGSKFLGGGPITGPLHLKQAKATARDYARTSRTLNDATTFETYSEITQGTLLYNYIPKYFNPSENKILSPYYGFVIEQLPEIQLKSVANWYNLHGYALERYETIKDISYFNSRLFFQFFQITNFIDCLDKSQKYNKQVGDYFNDLFNKGVRFWNIYSSLDDLGEYTINLPNINDFSKENWENNVLTELIIKESFKRKNG